MLLGGKCLPAFGLFNGAGKFGDYIAQPAFVTLKALSFKFLIFKL